MLFYGTNKYTQIKKISPQSKLIYIFSQEIFIVEDNNPGDIRPGNDFDAGEYEYDYYDGENQPDLSNPERIAGASNANKVSGSVRNCEIFNRKRDMA